MSRVSLARRSNEGFTFIGNWDPGLLESIYEAVLATGLAREGFRVERQKVVPMRFEGITYPESFRLDLLIEGQLVIEVKSTERNLPIYSKQLATYLRLIEQPVGLLMNFGYPTFREGLKRVSTGPLTSSRLNRNFVFLVSIVASCESVLSRTGTLRNALLHQLRWFPSPPLRGREES